jgi:sugar lactone lactonase YvrE
MNHFTRFTAIAFAAIACAGTGVLHADPLARHGGSKPAAKGPTVKPYATGLTNPRGLTFGPDGHLYVAEAGVGGGQVPADIRPGCDEIVNVFSPYTAGYSGRVLRVLADGTTQIVADGLPSATDATGVNFGPTDLAFLGGTLYVLIELGGCSHALPENLPAVLRVNPDGTTTNVANLNAWLAANPPFFINDNTDPTQTDFEPGGVFHSMFADGRYLYVVETNRGMLLRVDPRKRTIEKLYDMSIDEAEHNPIVMTRRGSDFYVGTFGEDGGPAELAVFDKAFTGYSEPFQPLNPIVGLAWHGNRLYGVEMFPYDNQWAPDSSSLVTFDPRTGERREVLTAFASYVGDMVKGPDGALYVSNQVVSFSFTGGDGSILRIVP